MSSSSAAAATRDIVVNNAEAPVPQVTILRKGSHLSTSPPSGFVGSAREISSLQLAQESTRHNDMAASSPTNESKLKQAKPEKPGLHVYLNSTKRKAAAVDDAMDHSKVPPRVFYQETPNFKESTDEDMNDYAEQFDVGRDIKRWQQHMEED